VRLDGHFVVIAGNGEDDICEVGTVERDVADYGILDIP
jgi:hypothetical protein